MRDQFDIHGVFKTAEFEIAQVVCISIVLFKNLIVRTVMPSTHNLCFGSRIKKNCKPGCDLLNSFTI